MFLRLTFSGKHVSQAFLVWQLTFSVLILGRRYTWNRLAGCFLVAAGVLLAVTRFSPLQMSNFTLILQLFLIVYVLHCEIYSQSHLLSSGTPLSNVPSFNNDSILCLLQNLETQSFVSNFYKFCQGRNPIFTVNWSKYDITIIKMSNWVKRPMYFLAMLSAFRIIFDRSACSMTLPWLSFALLQKFWTFIVQLVNFN